MTFKDLQKETTGTSPASKLHSRYNLLTNGKSRVIDWKLILERGFSYDDADNLISYLELRGAGMPTSSTVVKNLTDLMAQTEADPVASRVKVTDEALGIWEHVCAVDWGIDVEYIQDALNRYRGYLATCPEEYSELVPPKEFVFDWFTSIARYGSPRMRRFHLEHAKWKEYVSLIKRAKARG
jgi:hypothetical protein